MFQVDGATAAMYVEGTGNEGDVIVRDAQARQVIHANASNPALYVGAAGNEADVVVRDGAGRDTIHLDGGGSNVTVRRQVGNALRDVLRFSGSNAALYLGASGNEGLVQPLHQPSAHDASAPRHQIGWTAPPLPFQVLDQSVAMTEAVVGCVP